jgi:hypothetical protein
MLRKAPHLEESYLRIDVEGLKEAVQQFHPLG